MPTCESKTKVKLARDCVSGSLGYLLSKSTSRAAYSLVLVSYVDTLLKLYVYSPYTLLCTINRCRA